MSAIQLIDSLIILFALLDCFISIKFLEITKENETIKIIKHKKISNELFFAVLDSLNSIVLA